MILKVIPKMALKMALNVLPKMLLKVVTQGVPQNNELDDWIEKQIQNNPQISTDDSAELSNRS